MTTPPPENEEEVFQTAAALPATERAAYLDSACADRPTMRARIERLLGSHDATGFMRAGVTGVSSDMQAELHRMKAEEVGERIGPYKLLEHLGEGGFGVVWVAEQEQPIRRRVALKIIKMGMDTKEVIARFEQERQALALMDHPNIAKVFDAGATQYGRPYFVMELVRGVKITDYCDQANLPTAERLELFITVCQAVQHAHQKGIIHRDLKPSNILVTLHDGVPVPKVIDFGVAKATQKQRLTDLTIYTQFEQMIGTPLYMSPEQAELSGLDIDTRSDIYSLGVLLYELLTGQTPFDPEELMKAGLDEMRRVIREREPRKPSALLSTMAAITMTMVAQHRGAEPPKLLHAIRGDLDWIVMKALEKDRTRRYETANSFALDIHRHLASEPVLARPASNAYRFRRMVRRNRGTFAAGATVVAALMIGLAVSVSQAIRATIAEDLAKKRVVEVAAERDAKDEARQEAEAVSSFLIEVFESPDPERDGRTVTVAETLDRAARKLETDLASHPARRAKLQATLASTYHALGLDRDAIPLCEQALDYYFRTFGLEHSETLRAMSSLAARYDGTGRQVEALKIFEEVLALRRKSLGSQHPETLSALHNLASSYSSNDRYDEARNLTAEVVSLRRKILGLEHADTLASISALALLYEKSGELTEGLQLSEEVLRARRSVNGPEHPSTLEAMNNLGAFYTSVGRYDESLKLRETCLALNVKVRGPEHPMTAVATNNLAISYQTAGRLEDALKLHQDGFALRRKIYGPEHASTLLVLGNLGWCYHLTGRDDEAARLLTECLALFRRTYPPASGAAGLAVYRLALLYTETKQPAKAVSVLEEQLELCHKVHGAEHPGTMGAMYELAKGYHAGNRPADALKLREEVLALRRKVLGPEHADTLSAMHYLAVSYHHAGRRDEALKLREEVLVARRRVLGADHSNTFRAMHALAVAYYDAGRTLAEAFPLGSPSAPNAAVDMVQAQHVTALEAWFGNATDHIATCRRVLEFASGTSDASTSARAARAYCLRPSSDPRLLEAALNLARRAVNLGKTDPDLPLYQLALGMAEYRSEKYAAAEQALKAAAESPVKNDRFIQRPAYLFQAMSLFRLGRKDEAYQMFAQGGAQMKPLPVSEQEPLASKCGYEYVVYWLAYKEAKALLQPETQEVSVKPAGK